MSAQTSMEPYKKQITVETHRRDEPNDTRIAFSRGVGFDCATRRRKPPVFALTKTTDADDIQRMFDAY
jgi:hypothetical protein